MSLGVAGDAEATRRAHPSLVLGRRLNEEPFTASWRVSWEAVGAAGGEAEVEMKLGRQKGRLGKELLTGQDERRPGPEGRLRLRGWRREQKAGSHVEGSCRAGALARK